MYSIYDQPNGTARVNFSQDTPVIAKQFVYPKSHVLCNENKSIPLLFVETGTTHEAVNQNRISLDPLF